MSTPAPTPEPPAQPTPTPGSGAWTGSAWVKGLGATGAGLLVILAAYMLLSDRVPRVCRDEVPQGRWHVLSSRQRHLWEPGLYMVA